MPPRRLLLLFGALGLLFALLQLQLVSIAFDKLGLTPDAAALLLVTTLVGSAVNLPLFSLSAPWQPRALPPPVKRLFGFEHRFYADRIVVAVNVGGCVVPVAFSAYLLRHAALAPGDVLLAVALVAGVAYVASRPLAGVGIVMPVLVAPLAAALAATLLDAGQRAPLAYIGGTLGVLLGADLLRLPDVRRLGAPAVSIGGAGTFDGIFLAGFIGVLLA